MGAPNKKWSGPTARVCIRAPKADLEKLDKKVDELKARGIKCTKSEVIRVVIKKGLESVDEFFNQETITR